MNKMEIQKRRLRWKCRRGMLELDILLCKFFDEHYDTLTEYERETFAKLLAQEDIVLYAWFMEAEEPQEPAMKMLVARIVAL